MTRNRNDWVDPRTDSLIPQTSIGVRRTAEPLLRFRPGRALGAICATLLVAPIACRDSPSPATSDQIPPAAGVTFEMSIGDTDGPSESLFHQILDVIGFEDGGFWVLDGGVFGSDPRIGSYSSHGEFLGPVGRRGGGPGEYLAPYAMTTTADARVVIRDRMDARRLSVFTRDAVWDEDWTFSQPINGRAGTPETLVTDAEGVLWLQLVTSRPGSEPLEGDGGDERQADPRI